MTAFLSLKPLRNRNPKGTGNALGQKERLRSVCRQWLLTLGVALKKALNYLE
jgi:hypothetical protein